MKGDKKVIEHLNQILKNELTAINQYFLHSKIYKDWGIAKLAEKEYEEYRKRSSRDLLDKKEQEKYRLSSIKKVFI